MPEVLRPDNLSAATHPSQLIGKRVEVRIHPSKIEIRYAEQEVERLPRLRGVAQARINYRHVIWSLVRKPGAFARYRFREEIFPTLVFRRAYDALRQWRGERADVASASCPLICPHARGRGGIRPGSPSRRRHPVRLRHGEGCGAARATDDPAAAPAATRPRGVRRVVE